MTKLTTITYLQRNQNYRKKSIRFKQRLESESTNKGFNKLPVLFGPFLLQRRSSS